MRIHFVTRHPGALEWAQAHGVPADRVIEHLEAEDVATGDIVIGVLPPALAAAVCARGARLFALALQVPRELRGQELDAAALEQLDAQLQELTVQSGLSGAQALAELQALAAKRSDGPASEAQGAPRQTNPGTFREQ
jgi:CRISPR-associated protein Csx16